MVIVKEGEREVGRKQDRKHEQDFKRVIWWDVQLGTERKNEMTRPIENSAQENERTTRRFRWGTNP